MVESLKRSYSELLKYDKFGDRFDYLYLGDNESNSPRDISNSFYKSKAWLQFRREIIDRDFGSDLGIFQIPINTGFILVHHINPITANDLETYNTTILLNPENVITTSIETHNKIHYKKQIQQYQERKPGDTKLW